MFKEFKNFALRDNVVDMMVGVIMGGAFGRLVGSVIEDLVMPLVGRLIGNVDFSNLYFPLSRKVAEAWMAGPLSLVDAKKIGPVFAYGNFITTLLNFLILAFCIFMIVKIRTNVQKKIADTPSASTTKECKFCCTHIAIKATRCPNCTSALA